MDSPTTSRRTESLCDQLAADFLHLRSRIAVGAIAEARIPALYDALLRVAHTAAREAVVSVATGHLLAAQLKQWGAHCDR